MSEQTGTVQRPVLREQKQIHMFTVTSPIPFLFVGKAKPMLHVSLLYDELKIYTKWDFILLLYTCYGVDAPLYAASK